MRHFTSTYFVLTDHRHCVELDRIVLNACISMGLKFSNWSSYDVNVPMGLHVFRIRYRLR